MDGYRATCLNPRWGKAYHRRSEALSRAGKLTLAIESNREGCRKCDSDKADLKTQYLGFSEDSLLLSAPVRFAFSVKRRTLQCCVLVYTGLPVTTSSLNSN